VRRHTASHNDLYPQGESEHPAQNQAKSHVASKSAAESDAFSPDLQRVVDAWPKLTPNVRRAVLAVIGQTTNDAAKAARTGTAAAQGTEDTPEGQRDAQRAGD
jgi:hypothetical protein